MIKKLNSIAIILFSVLAISFTPSKGSGNSDIGDVILPSDFNNPELIFLVEVDNNVMRYRDIYYKRALKEAKENYKGNVDAAYFVDVDEKFPDKNIYKYFLISQLLKQYTLPNGQTRNISGYFLLNRLTGEKTDLQTRWTHGASKRVLKFLNTKYTNQ